MGFFSDIFGNSNPANESEATKRRKSLRNRICRIEEVETREMLSATPYEPPDAINVGAVYHEDAYIAEGTEEDVGGDTFVISWNGGADGTKLKKIVIDLSKGGCEGEYLYFNTDDNRIQPENGYAFDFTVLDDSDVGVKSYRISKNGQCLEIEFDDDFEAGMQFKFKIDVNLMQTGKLYPLPIVPGAHFEGVGLTAVFSSENYEELVFEGSFADTYNDPNELGLSVPPDEWFDGGDNTRKAMTAGVVEQAKEIQTPLKGSISGHVYEDVNNDGVKDPNEQGIEGVWLELFVLNDQNQYVSTGHKVQTGADGSYKFDEIEGGRTYKVFEAQPEAYADGKDTPGTIDGITVGEALPTDEIAGIHIGANEHGVDYNFGELKRASLSGYVYHDRNNDGNRDAGEEGIAGVRIKLQVLVNGVYRDVPGATTTTGSNGKYVFENLDPYQTYRIVEDQPEGWTDGKESVGLVDGRPVGNLPTDAQGNIIDNDTIEGIFLGYDQHGAEYNFGEFKKGSISGYVYVDEDGDGVRGPGEAGIDGVEIWLCVINERGEKEYIRSTTTRDGGRYSFDDLEAGKTYCVTEVDPEGYCDGETNVGTVGGEERGEINTDVPADKDQIHDIYIGSGESGINYNFGENLKGSLSGYVYVDANENGLRDHGERGIQGVVLTLWVWNGTEYVKTSKTATTDSTGYYEFDGLCPFNRYRITEQQPEEYLDGEESIGFIGGRQVGTLPANDMISDILLPSGGKGTDYNFGELVIPPPEPEKGSLSGSVYVDTNKNGVRDDGEQGISGVKISLWKLVNGTYVDTGKSTLTDSTGYYVFNNLDPNETYAIFETQPTAYDDGRESVGTIGGQTIGMLPAIDDDTIRGILLPEGGMGVNYNFGEFVKPVDPPPEPEKGSLSGYVYVDANKNGVRDNGEQGISGVKLSLWKLVNGTYVDTGKTATTNSSGYYIFDNLDPNETYKIAETQPTDYDDGRESVGTIGGKTVGTLPSVDDDTIRDILLPEGGKGVNYNFGELVIPPPVPEKGSLSGYVYVDANKNGVRDGGEKGISGVKVSLWKLVNGTYVDTGKTATTDSNGYYAFNNLDPNETYAISEKQPTAYDDGRESVGTIGGKTVGTLPGVDDDTIRNILLPEGGKGVNYNFGEFVKPVDPPPEPEKGSLSGYVYVDANKNGVRDGGEAGIGGVKLSLWKLVNGTYVDTGKTATTDSNGYYAFNNLDPNETYKIAETQPTAYDDGRESVGTIGGKTVGTLPAVDDDTIQGVLLPEGGKGVDYNFGEFVKPVDPPIDRPVVVPSMKPNGYRPVGAVGQGGSGSFSPNWQAPIQSESLRPGYGSGGLITGYSWHLSVLNGGYPRDTTGPETMSQGIMTATAATQRTMILDNQSETVDADAKTRYVSVAWTPMPMNQSVWYVRDKNGNVKKRFTFGPDGAIPLVADFNGDGLSNLAVYHEGNWYIDVNGNGQWDEEDLWCELGGTTDQPVVGDWDGDGKADIGVFGPQWSGDAEIVATEPGLPTDLNPTVAARPKNMPPEIEVQSGATQVRAMKHSQTGQVRLDVIDHVFQYGGEGDKAFTGDFSGDGIKKIGVYRNGNWYIDYNGNGQWDLEDIYVENASQGLGEEGIPVIGDWSGDGIDKIGLFVDGVWHLDTTGDFKFDTKIEFGQAGDMPVVGDFDGDGVTQLAVYRSSGMDSQIARSTPAVAPAQPMSSYAADAGTTNVQAQSDEASEDGGEGQKKLPEEFQRHGRSMRTPHTNAPLKGHHRR